MIHNLAYKYLMPSNYKVLLKQNVRLFLKNETIICGGFLICKPVSILCVGLIISYYNFLNKGQYGLESLLLKKIYSVNQRVNFSLLLWQDYLNFKQMLMKQSRSTKDCLFINQGVTNILNVSICSVISEFQITVTLLFLDRNKHSNSNLSFAGR